MSAIVQTTGLPLTLPIHLPDILAITDQMLHVLIAIPAITRSPHGLQGHTSLIVRVVMPMTLGLTRIKSMKTLTPDIT